MKIYVPTLSRSRIRTFDVKLNSRRSGYENAARSHRFSRADEGEKWFRDREQCVAVANARMHARVAELEKELAKLKGYLGRDVAEAAHG